MSDPKPDAKTAAQTEDEWEAKDIEDALGNALNPDGSIDFDKLRERVHIMTLDEFYNAAKPL